MSEEENMKYHKNRVCVVSLVSKEWVVVYSLHLI
jgi:hypothetical protein